MTIIINVIEVKSTFHISNEVDINLHHTVDGGRDEKTYAARPTRRASDIEDICSGPFVK